MNAKQLEIKKEELYEKWKVASKYYSTEGYMTEDKERLKKELDALWIEYRKVSSDYLDALIAEPKERCNWLKWLGRVKLACNVVILGGLVLSILGALVGGRR